MVGTYDGRCIFYSTDQLKYYTMIHVRSARGKNAQGRKVTGIEPMPGEDKILVTSNDSRIRLYDLRDLSLSCKFKGYVNSSSQIRASFRYVFLFLQHLCFLNKSSAFVFVFDLFQLGISIPHVNEIGFTDVVLFTQHICGFFHSSVPFTSQFHEQILSINSHQVDHITQFRSFTGAPIHVVFH